MSLEKTVKDSLHVGDLLRALRRKKRLTLIELGKKIGYSPAHICKVENGQEDAGDEMLKKLAKYHDVSYLDLCNIWAWAKKK